MIQVKLPDGTVNEYADDSTALDVALAIGARLASAVVAAQVDGAADGPADGQIADAMRPLAELTETRPVPLCLLTDRDAAALGVMRHSCAHVMARAVMRLFPGVSLAFGPTLGNGFYYDFDLEHKLNEEDFPKIEQEMSRIIREHEPFERFLLSRDKAAELCRDLNQDLKVEHIETGLGEHDQVSFYRQGEFVDLCRGPHIPHAGKIKAFKLTSVAGSYWKGDARNRQLQRLYGTAWFSKKALAQYLEQLEEAKRRDHRVLGRKLRLFTIDPEVGSGLCLWLPKGSTIRSLLEDFIKGELLARGYQPVYSPHIGRVEMYETSGHYPYYRESQFAPIFHHDAGQTIDYLLRFLEDTKGESPEQPAGASTTNEESRVPDDADDQSSAGQREQQLVSAATIMGFDAAECGYCPEDTRDTRIARLRQWQRSHERYLLKPMNCPHHVQMYKSQPRSYRELPVRLAEFGTVYRHEQTGELNGMLRVRCLTQDDAHIFCTPEQVEQEFRDTLELTKFVLESVGLNDYQVQLSLRDPDGDKYVGSQENWDRAEEALRRVLDESGLDYEECPGEAAFYGPKADFVVRDCIGRQWQLGTVQLDYNLPERFQLEYIGADNSPHCPVMIHRAPFGSMERFVGMLIEHFAGAFPLWLAPEQVRVLPLSEKSNEYAQATAKRLEEQGFRVTTDMRNAKVQAKIRDAQLELIPYMMVVGPREAESGTVALRDRIDGDLGAMPLADAVAHLQEEVDNRTVRQVVVSQFAAVEENTGEQHEY